MERRAAYQDLADWLAFMASVAPEFPPSLEMTMERALEKTFQLFAELRALEPHPDALPWLKLCEDELRAGRDAYMKGDARHGALHMSSAQHYLEDARGRKG